MTRPTRATADGAAYLALQRRAREVGRPTSETLQLYALEGFLDRLSRSSFADRLVLKGGVLLAAFAARRPTRDIDFQAQALANEPAKILGVVQEVARIPADDGLVFHAQTASVETIRDEGSYSGIRVRMTARLNRARLPFHVDVNVGDPVWPSPQRVEIPRILEGAIRLRGYPVAMVCAEKIITALSRGTANTRWRDFADLFALASRHRIEGTEMEKALRRVANYRRVSLASLTEVLDGYADVVQGRWETWLRKNALVDHFPATFQEVLTLVSNFADPPLSGEVPNAHWEPSTARWHSGLARRV